MRCSLTLGALHFLYALAYPISVRVRGAESRGAARPYPGGRLGARASANPPALCSAAAGRWRQAASRHSFYLYLSGASSAEACECPRSLQVCGCAIVLCVVCVHARAARVEQIGGQYISGLD
jgi:hypothetical protein